MGTKVKNISDDNMFKLWTGYHIPKLYQRKTKPAEPIQLLEKGQ